MRKIELRTIEMAGEEYPVYCDLYVLSKIQDRMSISEFERRILGVEVVRGEDGQPLYNDDNRIRLRTGKYDFETMAFGLALMINEGLEIREDQDGEQCERVTEKEVARICDIGYVELSNILHEEFNRCFEHKKKSKKTQKSQKKST